MCILAKCKFQNKSIDQFLHGEACEDDYRMKFSVRYVVCDEFISGLTPFYSFLISSSNVGYWVASIFCVSRSLKIAIPGNMFQTSNVWQHGDTLDLL